MAVPKAGGMKATKLAEVHNILIVKKASASSVSLIDYSGSQVFFPIKAGE